MNDSTNNHSDDSEQPSKSIQQLEKRITRLEAYLGLGPITEVGAPAAVKTPVSTATEESWEFRIGEYWLARVGAVILLLGIAFFISYPIKAIPSFLTSGLGFLAVVALFGLSHYWRKVSPYLSRLLFGGSLILLYFATLRLHFFTSNPVISSKAVGLTLLVVILGISFYTAVKRKSEILAGFILLLSYATSLFSNVADFTLILLTITSAVAVYLLVKYNWQTSAFLSLIMVTLAHLLWLLNNPILGNPIQLITAHHFNLTYLVIYSAFYGLVNIFRSEDSYSEFFEILLSLFNGMSIFMVGAVSVLAFFKPQVSLLAFATFFYFSIFAILNWNHTRSSYSTAYYACFGHVALSFGIFMQFSYPDYFIWLALQSLLVIITALWFRSKVIVLANILIFLGIFIAYLSFAPSNNFVNLSYAITSLASARILNWKKERLELKTDLIRNTYLVCAFIIVLYGLYHAIPHNYVSLAWIGAALFYLGMSLLLNNIKYRWMMMATIFATVIHIFIIDLARLAAGFRIIIFLAVGIVILILSLFYTRYRKNMS